MGANIHVHIEVKINGQWHHYAAPIVRRDYQLFAAVNGLRAEDIRPSNRPNAISTHHKLPGDISLITRLSLEEDRGRGLHDFGYLTSNDLVVLQNELYRIRPEVYRTGFDELDLEYSIFRTYVNGSTIASHPGYEDARVVYWYDG